MTSATQANVGHVDAWLAYLDRRGKSSHTIAAYRRGLEHFTNWNRQTYGAEAFKPAKIIPRDVRDWKSYQQTVEKAADSTIAQRMTALSQFFRWAERNGITASNPAADVSVSVPKNSSPTSLDPTDLRKLLRETHAAGNRRDIAIVETLAGTGVRVTELLQIQLGNLEIRPRSGKLVVREGKHGASRTVPLAVEVRKAITAYLQTEHPLVAERVSDPAEFSELNQLFAENPREPLWHGQRGPLESRSAITRILHKCSRAARIKKIGPHVLRHTFAYNFLKGNPGHERDLAALLGHKDLSTVSLYAAKLR